MAQHLVGLPVEGQDDEVVDIPPIRNLQFRISNFQFLELGRPIGRKMPPHLGVAGAEVQGQKYRLKKPVDVKSDDKKTRPHRCKAAGNKNSADRRPRERPGEYLHSAVDRPAGSGRNVARLAGFEVICFCGHMRTDNGIRQHMPTQQKRA